MADSKDTPRQTAPLGGFEGAGRGGGANGLELGAAALTLLWLGLSGAVVLFGDGDPDGGQGLRLLLTLLVVALPVALIWVAAGSIRASRVMREETTRLQASVEAIRAGYLAQAQTGRKDPGLAALTRKLDEIATAQRRSEAALALMATTRTVTDQQVPTAPAPARSAVDDQPALSLGTPAEALQPPLANADFIRALNFPETAEDKAGFAALRRALKDRQAAQLIQAAQDVLTLLSQDGIYMDDLRPDMARPEVWRAFAEGTRGREIAALGGVRDRSSLALASGRMKQDPIFRDAAHHFLRLFDKSVARFAPTASDSEVSELANTRSSRAFMLLGRVAGTFD